MTSLNQNLRYASLVLGVAIAVMLGWNLLEQSSEEVSQESAPWIAGEPTTERFQPVKAEGQSHVYAKDNDRRLMVGMINAGQSIDQAVKLGSIPWSSSAISSAYRASEGGVVRMLPAEVPVYAPIVGENLKQVAVGGRIPGLTIRLVADDNATNKLPPATRDSIVRYLREHEIAIEPTVYLGGKGALYFDGTCRAAFYRVATPSLTVAPEPLVMESTNRIRVLGVLPDLKTKLSRTLVLAIRYARTGESQLTAIGNSKYETELLFLHLLPDSDASKPEIFAFITSDGRKYIHRLGRADSGHAMMAALITTKIRFDSFVMMGMYPASPVVTGVVPYQSVQLPVEIMLRQWAKDESEGLASVQSAFDNFAISDNVSTWNHSK